MGAAAVSLARAAILACPGHWRPHTLARQLRVDVADLEAELATLPDLARGWAGELWLPESTPTRQRYHVQRRVDQVLARHAGEALTRQELAGLLGCAPGHALRLARERGAVCVGEPGVRHARWRLPCRRTRRGEDARRDDGIT
jgi:hypothetical protein